MPLPARLIAFDLDDTLAPSKSPLPSRMSDGLTRLLEHVSVAIISGGQIQQFRQQVIAHLGKASRGALAAGYRSRR